MPDTPKLTSELAQAKAEECRTLVPQAASDSQRIMLIHIAETWERFAAGMAGKQ